MDEGEYFIHREEWSEERYVIGYNEMGPSRTSLHLASEETRANRTGNPGMTVGGTGDVLASAASALASTLDPLQAGAVAAYANGAAGDDVVEETGYGLLVTDLLGALPAALWGDRDE